MTEITDVASSQANAVAVKRKILVLEDEPMILTDLAMEVEDHGMEALTATSPEDALAIVESEDISGAILDVNLGGDKTCEKVASLLGDMQIPFILHSGDLVRSGELVERLKAPIVRKPTPSCDVVKAITGLLN